MENGSEAYLTMLISYEVLTETMRFHFNMKEPNRVGSAFLAETDLQFNTHLDLAVQEDMMMLN